MNYIFYRDNKWWTFEGELPNQDYLFEDPRSQYYGSLRDSYNKAISDLMDSAVEVVNPESNDYILNLNSILHNDIGVEFYIWPGTAEKEEIETVEAEENRRRIERDSSSYAKDFPTNGFRLRMAGYIAGATAENERLTQVIEDLWIKIRNLQDAKLRDAETRGNVNRFG